MACAAAELATIMQIRPVLSLLATRDSHLQLPFKSNGLRNSNIIITSEREREVDFVLLSLLSRSSFLEHKARAAPAGTVINKQQVSSSKVRWDAAAGSNFARPTRAATTIMMMIIFLALTAKLVQKLGLK